MIVTEITENKIYTQSVKGTYNEYRLTTPINANMIVDVDAQSSFLRVTGDSWGQSITTRGYSLIVLKTDNMATANTPSQWIIYLPSGSVPGTQIKIWAHAWAYYIYVESMDAYLVGDNATINPTRSIRMGSSLQRRYGCMATFTYYENSNINIGKWWIAERAIAGATVWREVNPAVNYNKDETHKDNQQGAEDNRQEFRTPEHRERVQEEDSTGESGQSDRSKDSEKETEKQKPKGQRNNRKKTSD